MFAAINKTHEEVVSATSMAIHDALVLLATEGITHSVQDFSADVCEVGGLVQIDMGATCSVAPGPDGWISIFRLTEIAKEVERVADEVRGILRVRLSLGSVTIHQGAVSLCRITKRATGKLEICFKVRFTVG